MGSNTVQISNILRYVEINNTQIKAIITYYSVMVLIFQITAHKDTARHLFILIDISYQYKYIVK